MSRVGLVARSPAMRELLRQVRRFAEADANVLITGETGVGKDALARALHGAGPRRRHPFVKIDCPSLPTGLLESELFGHERGAFTDATAARAGPFEQAGLGTAYLDNVGELPLGVQGKLLRLVEEKRVERLGGTGSIAVNARIIASASSDLEASVQQGAFRDDLYHRLRVLPLRVRPLRERRADIAPLAQRFLREACARHFRRGLTLAPETIAAFQRHPWPGNVRELQHVIERAVLGAEPDQQVLAPSHLPLEVLDSPEAYFGPDGPSRPTLAEVERRYIELVLREVRDNQTEAAHILGISRKALWQKRRTLDMR